MSERREDDHKAGTGPAAGSNLQRQHGMCAAHQSPPLHLLTPGQAAQQDRGAGVEQTDIKLMSCTRRTRAVVAMREKYTEAK